MNSANVQFAVIIVGILAGIFLNNRAVERLEDRLSKSEDRTNTRFSALEAKMDTRFSALEAKMDSRFNAMDARIDRIFSEFSTFHSIQGEHKAKIDALEKER